MEDGIGSVGLGLKSFDSGVRLQALWRVGNSRIGDHVEDVLRLMKVDRSPDIKARCAWVLGRLRFRAAYPYLVANLKHRSSQVRVWSAWGLGELGLEQARGPLQQAMEHESEDKVRRAIGGALKTLDFESTRMHRSQVLRALRPPWTDDGEIMGIVEQLETRVFHQNYDEIIALRSRIKTKDPVYLVEYMSWVRRKPALIALADDDRRVFR